MPRNLGNLARSLSIEEIQTLLSIKEQLTEFEARRAEIETQLKQVDQEILGLVRKLGAGGGKRKGSPRRKRRSTAAKKRSAGKKTRSASGTRRRSAASRKQAASARGGGRGRGKGGKSLERVVVDLIQSKGGTLPFTEIKSTILKNKLFKTRSKNFDNVLRRTISSSDLVQRVSRGVYTA